MYGAYHGCSQELVTRVIAGVRTDFDSFSDAEQAVLENHGYIFADAAVREHAPQMISAHAMPYRIPHGEWMDEERVGSALKDSGKRRLFS